MRRLIASLLLLLAMVTLAYAQTGELPRSAPEAQGLSTKSVNLFIDSLLAVPQSQLHHALVVRHGHVVAEVHPSPYRAEDAHTLYSASKTFTSIAVGLAIADNRLRLDDRVAALMHDYLPDTVSTGLAQMTVRHLLTMSSGITPDWEMRNQTNDWERLWLSKPVSAPGERLQYDSMATYMLSAIVQRVTGKTVLQLLSERIFGPMHITEVDWELSPSGVCTGGWGMRIQAESLAKVGIMLLQRGQWEGRQLVPEWWIDEMTTAHVNYDNVAEQAPTDGNQGYGYQVWRCKWPTAYRADGAYGQFVMVDPATDIVVVILGMSYRAHDELACIWEQLMPGVDRGGKADKKSLAQLERKCRQATLPLPSGSAQSPRMSNADFKLAQNRHGIDVIKVYRDNGQMLMRLYYHDGHDETLPLGYANWQYGHLTGEPPYSITPRSRFAGLKRNFATAASYAWTSPTRLNIDVQYVNFISATTFDFDIERSTVTITDNFARSTPETIDCAIVKQ